MSNLPEFNLQSSQHLSLLFFGGFLAMEETQSDGFYKNGNPKTKKVKVLKNIQGLGLKPLKEWKTKKEGIYSVDEGTLTLLAKGKEPAATIANVMLEIRGLNKLLSTYYNSVEDLIYPDGYVHPQFNHVATATGRLSAKNPNVQNQSNEAKVTEHFVSRFQDGVLISSDYSSIEPRCEAQMSGDVMYISDIINDIDPHTKNLSLKLKQPYEAVLARVKSGELEEARKKVKGFTFAVQYGAGNQTVSNNSGLTIEEVKDLKEQRELEYFRLHQYYDWLRDIVNKTGEYQDPWGRRYKFKKYPPRFKWQKSDSYSPNEIQNFRTQGFATATIVLSMLGIFWRQKALHNRNIKCMHSMCENGRVYGTSCEFECLDCKGTGKIDKYLLINTVHDSVMLDSKKEYEEIAREDLKILTSVATISKKKFNYEFIVPIEIQITSGKNWSEL